MVWLLAAMPASQLQAISQAQAGSWSLAIVMRLLLVLIMVSTCLLEEHLTLQRSCWPGR